MSGHVDVAVVGAGPAGSAAAITAVRAGAKVALLDRAHFPRDKCCGDGLTTAGLRHLAALGLDLDALGSFVSVSELLLRSASGRSVVLPLTTDDGPAAAVCSRFDLDAGLVALARSSGAEVKEGAAFQSLEETGDSLTLSLSNGEQLVAGAVVAADGAWSAVRRALPDAGARRGEPQHWHAYRAYVQDVSPAAAGQLFVAFEDDLLPGYGWSFPLAGERANIGVCLSRTTRRAGAELARLCEQTLEGPVFTSFLGPRARRVGPVRSWPIPAPVTSLPLSALSGRVLFVGDAARASDPFTGEGIAQALETGIAAGAALTTAATPRAAATQYRQHIAHGLAADQRIASWCNALMVHRGAPRAVIELARLHPTIAKAFGRFLYEDYPRAAVLRPSSWPALARHRPLPENAPARRAESGQSELAPKRRTWSLTA